MTAHALLIRPAHAANSEREDRYDARARTLMVLCGVLLAFAAIAGQLVRLALKASPDMRVSLSEPLVGTWSRPDIVDRNGRLIATDVATNSLYADPQSILDLDEVIEKLTGTLGGLDAAELRRTLGDHGRRFAWIARGLTPRQAQRVHALGLPGLAFRTELKRVYPSGALTGHLVGTVNVDNRGIAGLERMLDDTGQVDAVLQGGGLRSAKAPLRLSLDIGVQHALAEELRQSLARYFAAAAAGLVLDASSGEILAAVSLPEADPQRPADWLDATLIDRNTGGTYELGSIFKSLTIAMVLDAGTADLDKIYDVRQPISAGPYTIKDLHPQPRPLSVRDIFLHSSNIGAGLMALEAGTERQRAFLARMGLTAPMRTEAGPVAAPQLPKHWGKVETATIAFGHGIAVAPLQFTAAFAALVNGGLKVTPTLMAGATAAKDRLISGSTSAKLREILRLNVTSAAGSGRRAEAEGYRVGGKTGTAEIPGRGGYQEKAVISSFVSAFPMDAPRYVMLAMLFEPQIGEAGGERITAGLNASPLTARIVERIAPLLGILPRLVERRGTGTGAFDAPRAAQ